MFRKIQIIIYFHSKLFFEMCHKDDYESYRHFGAHCYAVGLQIIFAIELK